MWYNKRKDKNGDIMRYISFGDKGIILNILKNYRVLKDSQNLDAIENIIILDELIDKCNFSGEYLNLIDYIKSGYSYNEIIKKTDLYERKFFRKLEKSLNAIVELNDYFYFHSINVSKRC